MVNLNLNKKGSKMKKTNFKKLTAVQAKNLLLSFTDTRMLKITDNKNIIHYGIVDYFHFCSVVIVKGTKRTTLDYDNLIHVEIYI